MKGILLRGLCQVMTYVLTLPLRLIVIIVSICYMAYTTIRYELSFMEFLNVYITGVKTGVKTAFLNEITWVKTGNCKDFDELITDIMSEEES